MPTLFMRDLMPGLYTALTHHLALNDQDFLWTMLRRLLVAHAPSSGANLPGGIGEDIAVLSDNLGLSERLIRQVGATGNQALWLGVEKPQPDIVVVAHMDRPSYRVRAVNDGLIYPICANRFPMGDYRANAKAVRFVEGRLTVAATGMLVSDKSTEHETLRFEVKQGVLEWHDTILLDANPTCDEQQQVVGTGLDNCLGVLIVLLTAAMLHASEATLRERGQRCLFVFTDQEEGPPTGFFGHGAARLTYAVPPPTYGCIVVDAQNAGMANGPTIGQGVSVGAVSNWGRGSVVPPNYHALAVDLAAVLNEVRPSTVQMNNGYLSRSDDMILGRWSKILALVGAPLAGAHTAQETAHLNDIQSGVWWLSHLLAAHLSTKPELMTRYALMP